MKNKDLGIVIGAAAVGVGGFFLFKALLAEKKDVVLQYYGASDVEAAKVIKDAIRPKKFVQGYVDPLITTKDMIIVGSQMVNPVYALLVENGVFPAVTQAQAGTGFIYVRQAFGHTFYGVGGWLAADTMKAANYIKNAKALPTSDIHV